MQNEAEQKNEKESIDMTDETDFPHWICYEYQRIQSYLSPSVGDRLDECRRNFQNLSRVLKEFPESEKIDVIHAESPTDVQEYFRNRFGALTHICKYWVGYWHHQHVYKVKAYFDGINKSMEIGNWLVACSCLRSLLEEVTHFDLFLNKISIKFRKYQQLIREAMNHHKKKKIPSHRWVEDFVRCLLDIGAYVSKCAYGSDFNWDGFAKNFVSDIEDDHTKANVDLTVFPSKVHVNDCIKKSQKHHYWPFEKHYNILSETCHPNLGSTILVIADQKRISDQFSKIRFSHNIHGYNGASRFFEIACDPMISTLSVGYQNINMSQYIYSEFVRNAKKHLILNGNIIK